MKKVLYIVNVDWFFISHRLPIAKDALEKGYEVHIACGLTGREAELKSSGLIVHPVPFARSEGGLFNELKTFLTLLDIIKSVQPDIVHAVTIKPVLYGGIASRFAKVGGVVFAVSGLGLVFVAEGFKAKLRKFLVSILYKFAFSQKVFRVIFQNPTDKAVLQRAIGIDESNCVMIKGSGADLSKYVYKDEPEGIPVIVMASRLLREKGVYQFVEAARILRSRNIAARFQLVGEPDYGNPNTVTREELEAWRTEGVVELLGFRADVEGVFADANIVALPSFYGEGVPKVLIEAAACGRAIVTTNNPGCAEAVVHGKTGLIVPVRDPDSLANAIVELILKPDLRKLMGKEARCYAEREFDVKSVVSKHLEIYQEVQG